MKKLTTAAPRKFQKSPRVSIGLDIGDPATLATTILLLTATGVLASWIPAWRAARVDPPV